MEFKSLEEIISHYEKLPSFHNYNFTGTLNKYIKDNNISDKGSNEFFESIAFGLQPSGGKESRGTYYGPMLTYKGDDGNVYYSPDISFITNDCIDYREKRMNTTKSSFMKNHYADLLFDFREKVCGDKGSNFGTYAQNIISTTLDLINEMKIKDLYGIVKIRRAIDVAIITSNDLLDLITACIDFESRIAVDDKPGLRGFSYDLLYNNKKISKILSSDNLQKIIKELEERIKRLTSGKGNARAIKQGILRLLEYYKGNESKTKYYIELLEDEFKKDIHSNSNGLLKQGYLEEIKDIYVNFGKGYLRATNKKIAIVKEMLGLKEEIKNSMQKFSTSYEITKEEMDNYISFFFSEDSKILEKIIINFLPNKEKTTELVKKLASEHPLVYLINKKIIDDNGMPIIEIGGIDKNLELHIITQMTQDISLGEPFIGMVMEKFVSIKNICDVLSELKKSPAFANYKDDLLTRVLGHYYNGNYFEFCHVAIPMIEGIMRFIIEMAGGTTIKSNNMGGYDKKAFGDLIFDQILTDIFGEDFILYNRVLFCERAGLNLRNKIAHGIDPEIFYSKNIANRVFHILLYFSILRRK